MNAHHMIFFPAGLAAALVLAGCGGQPEPTPTPTKTPVGAVSQETPATPTPAQATATQVAATEVAAAATSSPTPGAFAATVAAGAVAAVADDAVSFALAQGPENVTADQLTAALLGVLGRLRDWTAGTGGESALADCRALLPGVIARAENRGPLEALLQACESGEAQQVGAALGAFEGLLP